jgi:hypothetical protein
MKWREARAAGVPVYDTGKPCKSGHTTGRRTSTGQCLGCRAAIRSTPAAKASRRRTKNKPVQRFLRAARDRAKAKGLPFSLKAADIRPLVVQTCPLLGIPLFYGAGRGHTPGPNNASLDRIDSTKGYVPGNVWIISSRANTIKSNATLEEFERIAQAWRLWL